MSDDKTCKYNRFTLEDRKHIETDLDNNLKLKDIAEDVSHDARSVSYEIKSHRQLFVKSSKRNKCGLQEICEVKHLCSKCNGVCKACSCVRCNENCDLFQETPECKKILRFPYVCNGCDRYKECSLPKMLYRANDAQNEYEHNVSDYKCGPKIDAAKLKDLDYLISQSIRNGHSIAVALKVNNLQYAPSTIYSYVDKGLMSVKNIDLKRKVRYKVRKKKTPAYKIEYDYLQDRKYQDFINLFQNNPNISLWQMDTVEGTKGVNEPGILTLLHVKSNLQLLFYLETINQEEVIKVFKYIKELLGNQLFSKVFEVILTDNGKEFKDPVSIEYDEQTGEVLTKVFYCETRRSDEKGKCEKNHVHIREFIPKGFSFKTYSQKDIEHISNMINNYPRGIFNYNSPYQVAQMFLNEKVFKLNNLEYVSPDKVILKRLFK